MERLPLSYTSKPQVSRTELLCPRPHLSIIDNYVGVFFIYLCRRPPVDHLGVYIPQRRLFVRGRFVGSLSNFCIPYPTAVLAVASHRAHSFIHRRQSPNVLWHRGGDQAIFAEILAHLLCFIPVYPCARPSWPIRSPDEIQPVSLHQSSLKITIIDALGHPEDRFYAKYGEGQNGESNGQGDSYPAWSGTTEPVKHAKANQWHHEEERDRVGERLKEPGNEQGKDHM